MRNEKNTGETLKVIFVIIGAVVSIAALAAVVYTVFKKYFQVTFECSGDCADCENCFDEDEDAACEPDYTDEEIEPENDIVDDDEEVIEAE